MARKKKVEVKEEIIPAEILDQPITETIETNYMPYVMSVIISRAIPQIDGFKPSHRKLLYTMYTMGLIKGQKTKSANIVGQTMKLNPHGDASIYETMVRLTRGHEALLYPFVDSKGSFGKHYSRDMAYAASRYTEAKLDPICNEIFAGIDKDAVDLVPNYDNTTTEPTLLPTTFPNILVSPNMGIAVGLASNICSFNLGEICDGTIALLKNPRISVDRMMDIIKAPDFSTGAYLVYDKEQIRRIFEKGTGSVKLLSKYVYDKANNCIDILEIPYSTSIEAIMKKLVDLIKEGKLKEVTDLRDEIDLKGFKLTLDLRRGTDPDKLMAKLYKMTPLKDEFSCNFNVLIDSSPRQLGVVGLLEEWIKFRLSCLSREMRFDLQKKKDKLHLLKALSKVLLDIDKAIKIIRETEKEVDVVPRLMEGFSIDRIQAEYIAEIKLRHLNHEYLINRVHEIEGLRAEIKDIEETLADEIKMKTRIAEQLKEIKKKYSKPRKTEIVYADEVPEAPAEEEIENYSCRVVLTRDGYFKKITHQSLRGNDEHRLKDGDEIIYSEDCENRHDFIVFTDKCQVYKAKVSAFEPVKASSLGDFLPSKLGFDDGERPIMMKVMNETFDQNDHVIFVFQNGKGVRIPLAAYETKSNRRRLTGAYSAASPIVAAIYEKETTDVLIVSDVGKGILLKSSIIPEKTTRTAAGVILFNLKKKQTVVAAVSGEQLKNYPDASKCRKIKIPATGSPLMFPDIQDMQIGIE
ncbi:MAG: topoisomerase IV [Clostridia bacterium]|nr:topoisomerase IV [Clostridia bacterium]